MKTFNQFNEAVHEGKHPGAFPIDQIDSYIRDLNALDKKWDHIVDFTNIGLDTELGRNKRALVGLIQGDLRYANEAYIEHQERTKELARSIRKYLSGAK